MRISFGASEQILPKLYCNLHNYDGHCASDWGVNMSTPQKPNTRRRCLFIKLNEETVYVPRPTSWLGGWARSIWLATYFGKGVARIASPSYWSQLETENTVMTLTEADGSYSESVYDDSP